MATMTTAHRPTAATPTRSRLLSTLGALLLLAGAIFLVGGIWLLALGGTWLYLPVGVGWAAAGLLLMRRRPAALVWFGVTYVLTWVWALAEVGLRGWALEPRVLLPTLFGMLLLTPWVGRRLPGRRRTGLRTGLFALGAVGLAAAAVAGLTGVGNTVVAAQSAAQPPAALADLPASGADDGREWRNYGRTERGERYVPLAQITPANVAQLQPAWHLHTGDLPRPGENENGHEFNDEATPIKVGDSLYFCTPHRKIFAVDAQTGAVRWTFDPQSDTSKNAYLACRGVAFYEAPQIPSDAPCHRRIIATTADARLMALDAERGTLCPNFGQGGYVSLRQHLGHVPMGFHFISSQPLVVHGKVMLGGWIYDGQATNEPSGVVRTFDAVTGEMVWAWDMGSTPQNVQHPAPGDRFTVATPNAWGTYTADLALNLVFLPTGNAVPDYYGPNRRPFDDKYSSSVVALDIDTGAPKWSFQTLHHDLWDMDVPIGPTLVDLTAADGSTVPALVQTTKRGEIFLLDRRDGHPLAPVEEKPAPQGALPEENATLSRTQPYSVGMPSFGPDKVTEADAWGATPFDQLLCRIDFKSMRYDGAYTPITERKTLVYPSFDGIIDWYGATVDPRTKRMYANLSYIPFTAKAIKRAEAEAQGLVPKWNGKGDPPPANNFAVNPQYGTPYVVVVNPWLNVLGVPCKAPPWGRLAAVDLVTRKIAWLREVGTSRDNGPFRSHFGLPLTTGVFGIGGSMATASGLLFMGATADDYLRAFDTNDGRELWRTRLPAGGQATPMSYLGSDGRQYVVISVGGHGGLGTRSGDEVIAYALPK